MSERQFKGMTETSLLQVNDKVRHAPPVKGFVSERDVSTWEGDGMKAAEVSLFRAELHVIACFRIHVQKPEILFDHSQSWRDTT